MPNHILFAMCIDKQYVHTLHASRISETHEHVGAWNYLHTILSITHWMLIMAIHFIFVHLVPSHFTDPNSPFQSATWHVLFHFNIGQNDFVLVRLNFYYCRLLWLIALCTWTCYARKKIKVERLVPRKKKTI